MEAGWVGTVGVGCGVTTGFGVTTGALMLGTATGAVVDVGFVAGVLAVPVYASCPAV